MWMGLLFLVAQATSMSGMEMPQAACSATPAPLPSELASWNKARPVVAGFDETHATTLVIGMGAKATLLSTPKILYALRPEKPGDAASSGGIFGFDVPATGRYRIALGSAAWIDVIEAGRSIVSVAHGHGPACTPVKKTVDFALQPGRYLLQIAGSETPTLSLMVAKLQ